MSIAIKRLNRPSDVSASAGSRKFWAVSATAGEWLHTRSPHKWDIVIDNTRYRIVACEPSSDWLSAASKQLEALAHLGHNWNSYGAEKPSRAALDDARTFVEELHCAGVPPYRIAPSAIGGVGITIKDKGQPRRAYVEFRNDGGMYCLLSDGTGKPIIEPVRLGAPEFRKTIERAWGYLNAETTPQAAAWAYPLPSHGVAGRRGFYPERISFLSNTP
jgi:hypothetical protein